MERKTFTLRNKTDDPVVSLCPGHVSAPQFQKAFQAEGWIPGDPMPPSSLRHEWWVKKGRSWKQCKETDDGALPLTAMSW